MGRVGICVGLVLWLGACEPPVMKIAGDEQTEAFPTPDTVDTGPVDPNGLARAWVEGKGWGEPSEELDACAADPFCEDHAEALSLKAHLMFNGAYATPVDPTLTKELREATEPILAAYQASSATKETRDAIHLCMTATTPEACDGTPVSEIYTLEELAAINRLSDQIAEQESVYRQQKLAHLETGLDKVSRAAQLGSVSAKSTMGGLLMTGRFTVPCDLATASGYLADAADSGDPEAAYNLAQLIHHGLAPPTHDVVELLRFSYRNGRDLSGHALLDILERQGLEDSELAAAMRDLDDYKPRALMDWDPANHPPAHNPGAFPDGFDSSFDPCLGSESDDNIFDDVSD